MTTSRRRFLQTSGVALSAPFLVKLLGDRAEAALTTPQYLVPFTDSKYGQSRSRTQRDLGKSRLSSLLDRPGLECRPVAAAHLQRDVGTPVP